MRTEKKINANRSSKSVKKHSHASSDAAKKYQALFEQSPYGILLFDAEGKILDFNETAHRDLGYTREEFADLTIADIDPVESTVDVKARISRILEKGRAEFETRHRTKQGEIRDVHVTTKVVNLSGHTVCQSTWRDITEQKRAEDAARKSGNKFRALFNSVNDSILIHDFEGRILEVNDVICRLLGYSREELLRMSPRNFDAPEAAKNVPANIRNITQKGEHRFESEQMTRDGRRIPVDVSARVIDFEGKSAIISVCRDITERKRSEDALLASEERLRQSVRVSNLGIFEHDHRVETLYWSPRQREIYGWGPDETVTFRAFIDSIHPEDRERIAAAVRQAHNPEGDGLFAVEHRIIRRDGSIRWVTTRSQTFFSGEGEARRPVQTIGAVRDITEEKQAEEKVQESEQFIRNILDTVDEGFIVIDRAFRILTANKAYCDQVGGACDTIIGRHCYEISHRADRPCYEQGEECAVRHVFETGEPHAAFHKHSDAQGSILYVETKAFPIKDSTGAVTSAIETINNITEKHLLEEEQLKSQKLEAIGILAGGIAHDFNNLFQGVFGFISMAKRTHDQKQKSLDMLEQAEQALHMSVSLASQLLTFSKGGRPVTKRVALRPVIENSVKFALSGSRVNYRLQIDEGLRMVEADEGQLGQVIQNLVLNAEQAMPMGGTIAIAAKNVPPGQKGLSPVLREGNYVELSLSDSGIGIPEEYIPKIFDPYFTTKLKGSGLGLATSYSIIKNHGGFIDVKSQLGKGTTFIVYLPAVEAAETPAVNVPRAVKALRNGRILLMDDEDVVRNVAGVMMRSFGHEVEVVDDGKGAIVKYRESMKTGRKFDIVIMDLTVRGGMGGEEAMRELLQIDPDINAIVSSGYSDSAVISEYKTRGFKAYLSKPYDIDSLNRTLNILLD
jgi:two-component system cell cycle sensor histidine kinase/response regulator CckA